MYYIIFFLYIFFDGSNILAAGRGVSFDVCLCDDIFAFREKQKHC